MKRRDFLAAGASIAITGAGLAALPRARAGQPRARRRLLIVFASGGWDMSYALDPKEPPKVDVPVGRRATYEHLDVFVDDSRPAITRYFEAHAAQTAIVRGICIDAINHLECQRRIATGTREETRPDFGAIVAHDAGNDLPIPYLVLGPLAWTGPYTVSSARIGGNNQIVDLVNPALAPAPTTTERELLRAYAAASVNRAHATRGATGYNRRRVDDFAESLGRADALRALRRDLGARGEALSFDGQIGLAVSALEHDLSHVVMLNPLLPFDTHLENYKQSSMQDTLFAGLDKLVLELERRPGRAAGTQMIDDTLVAVVSEMGRTPHLSAPAYEAGKEHWPVTCAMLIGSGVHGGSGFGATTDDQLALPVDLATGAPAPTGTRTLHTHFVAGVLAACGVDPEPHFPGIPVFDAFVA